MKNNEKYCYMFSEEDKENLRKEYLDGSSIRELCIKHNIKSRSWLCNVLKGITRTFGEASKLAHKKFPERFKHTKEAKLKMRIKRLEYMKLHSENTAWRKRNRPSYPELCFIKYIKDRELDKKYLIEREKPFFPFYADFAFINIKLVVEIDGSQHLEKSRKAKDKIKEKVIKDKGWNIVRISEDTVKHDWRSIDEFFSNLNSQDFDVTPILGIIKSPKLRLKLKIDGQPTEKQKLAWKRSRRCEWPTKEILWNLIVTKSFVEIGKIYNVSDKTISKWCKYYGLPFRRRDLKSILNGTN